MKSKTRKIAFFVAFLLMVGAFFWMRELASWRPQLVGVQNRKRIPGGVIWRSKVKISLDGRLLALFDAITTPPTIWDLEQKKLLFRTGSLHHNVVFSPDSRLMVLYNGPSLDFSLLHARTGKLVRKFSLPPAQDSHPVFSRDGREIFYVAQNQLWRLNVKSGEKHRQVDWGKRFLSDAEIRADASEILSLSEGGLNFYDARKGQHLGYLGGTDIIDAGWSPDGKFVWVWNGKQQNVNFLKVHRGQSRFLHGFSADWHQKIHFTRDSKFFAVATNKGLEMRDVMTGKLVKTLPGPREEPFDLSPDGNFAISVDNEGKIWRWRLK